MADLADLSMLDLFRIELENYSKLLESGLVDVEKSGDPESIETLMRAAHSIKGAARLVGLDAIVGLAHSMEDVLSAARQGKLRLGSEYIDRLLKGNDIFISLARVENTSIEGWLKEQGAAIEELSKKIHAILSTPPVVQDIPEKPPIPKEQGVSKLPDTQEIAPKQQEIPVKKDEILKAKPSEKEEESFVRVVSESLNRLMGFAGECLVQAKSAKPFSASLLKMKDYFMDVYSNLENIFYYTKGKDIPREIQERFGESLRQLDSLREVLSGHIVDFELFSRNLEHLADKLYGEAIAIRMRPFSDGLHGFPRMVRDLTKALGKKVDFQIIGESTKIDRDILEKMESPLTHLLRIALDHGIEAPQERLAAGKTEEGLLTLEAHHSSGMLHITVSDDGRGIDIEKLRSKIVEKGHCTPEMARDLSDEELLNFLFLPGFSTARDITEVSGRGVGLDVVLTMVQGVGGSVRVETKKGSGTSFHLQLPLTLSVLRTLLVEISGETYAIPLTRIDFVIVTNHNRLKILEDKQFYTFENENIGIIDAHQVLRLPSTERDDEDINIVVISDRMNRYGLVVDRFLGERELVVIPLDVRLGKVPNISAGAVLEDGSPVLILDVDDLVRSIDNLLNLGRLKKVGGYRGLKEAQKKHILVVDDSLTVREVERRLLENAGYEVKVAVDGVDGFNALQLDRFDLIVSDIDMPRMNGIDLVKKIRSDPNLKEIPIIIVSYKERAEDRIKGLEAGANYYLTKSSFQDEGLINAVRDLIGGP